MFPAYAAAQTPVGQAVEKALCPDPEPQRTPATSVDTLWNRTASTLQGTFMGAVLGLGLGIVAVSTGLGGENVDTTVIWLGSGGVGTAGRGYTGAPPGTAIPRWKRRYP
jgi:hypothetical protein